MGGYKNKYGSLNLVLDPPDLSLRSCLWMNKCNAIDFFFCHRSCIFSKTYYFIPILKQNQQDPEFCSFLIFVTVDHNVLYLLCFLHLQLPFCDYLSPSLWPTDTRLVDQYPIVHSIVWITLHEPRMLPAQNSLLWRTSKMCENIGNLRL